VGNEMPLGDPISFAAFVVSMIALAFTYRQMRIAEERFSLDAFMRSLEELGSDEAREKRNYILNNFPDYSISDVKIEKQSIAGLMDYEVPVWLYDGNGAKKEILAVRKIGNTDEKYFVDVAVGFDRVGFMLFELDLPKGLKDAYFRWMASTICDVWNKIAPYIYIRRQKRVNYTPYFEEMAYQAYSYYRKQKKNVKLVCLKLKPFERVWGRSLHVILKPYIFKLHFSVIRKSQKDQ